MVSKEFKTLLVGTYATLLFVTTLVVCTTLFLPTLGHSWKLFYLVEKYADRILDPYINGD